MLKLKKVEELLFFLVILFLPTQLGRHFWPDFSYVYSLKVDYLSPTVYFWDFLVIGLLITWLFGKPKINWLAFNLLLIFLLSQVISLVGVSDMSAGLVRLEQYVISGLFGVYIASMGWKFLGTKIYLPLSLAVLFESVLATFQFTSGGTLGFWILGERSFSITTPAIAKFDFYGREFLRPYATFPHPNVLAAFMTISIVILNLIQDPYNNFYRFRLSYGQRLIKSKVTKIAALMAGATILVTFSRTAILAGLGAGFILIRGRGRILLIVGILLLLPILYTRYASLLNFDNLTVLRREELTVGALHIFQTHPFFGVGLNNFIPALSSDLIAGPSRFLQPVHNIFLLTLAETGILGLLGLLGFIGYPIIRLFKQRTLFLLWGIIVFLGLFDHYFLTLPQGQRMLFLVWGISFSMLEFKDARSS